MKAEGYEEFSLRATVEHYARYLRTLRTSKTMERASEEFLEVREAEGKSATHLADLRYRVNRFERAFVGGSLPALPRRKLERGYSGSNAARRRG